MKTYLASRVPASISIATARAYLCSASLLEACAGPGLVRLTLIMSGHTNTTVVECNLLHVYVYQQPLKVLKENIGLTSVLAR